MKGKVVAVTGASDGMGKATASILSESGADVTLAARRFDIIQHYAEEIRDRFGTDPLAVKVDVSSDDDVKSLAETMMKKYSRIDYVVNFAGNAIGYKNGDRRKPIYDQSIQHLKEIAEVDHFGSARILKYMIPYMLQRRFGKIVLISATSSVYGYSEDVDYIPYKKANEGLALSTALRSEKEHWGIRFYTIAPGDVYTPSTWDSYSEAERIEALKYGVLESKTIAKIVSWLLSGQLKERYEMRVNLDTGEIIDEGKYVPLENGDTIVVDAKTVPKLFKSAGEECRTYLAD